MFKVKRVKTVSHVVRDINAAVDFYAGLMHQPKPKVTVSEGDGIKMATFVLGDTTLQLMEPINYKAGIQRFLKDRGEGVHHITLLVDNPKEVREECVAKGIKIVDSHAADGDPMRSFWVHFTANRGVLTEISKNE